jgi:hypothetical protein
MKKIIFVCAAIAALASCQKPTDITPDAPQQPNEEKLRMNVVTDIRTKVTDTYFESGDKVGIYVVSYRNGNPGTLAVSGNLYDNVMHTYSSSWTAAQEMYWPDKETPADFYCYYPYGNPGNVTEYPFTVNADQSSLNNYKASDFVWGKSTAVAPTEDLINIATHHAMSNIHIYIKPGDGFTAESLAAAQVQVSVRNVKNCAYVNLSTGNVTATGSISQITPYNEGEYYRAIVVPQTVADGSQLIVVNVNGVDYALRKGFTFLSGKQHKFTVSVNKTGSGVNVGVGDWEVDTEDNGGDAE